MSCQHQSMSRSQLAFTKPRTTHPRITTQLTTRPNPLRRFTAQAPASSSSTRSVGAVRTTTTTAALNPQQLLSPLTNLTTPTSVFDITTLFVLPCYALMVVAPKLKLTRRVMGANIFYWGSAVAYAALLSFWKILPHAVTTVKAMGYTSLSQVSQAVVLPKLAAFATFFSTPQATALAWIHLVFLDLFQARWVYADGLREGIPTAHSLVLCFMVGPLGLVSHLVTKAVVQQTRGGKAGDQAIVYHF